MRQEQLQLFKSWFKDYVNYFAANSKGKSLAGIKLKEEHTWRVCENIIKIAQSLNLEEKNLLLAETMALFHDIGRFKQIYLYDTFNDRASENHALLGVKELKRTEVLSELINREENLILKSIEHHNQLNIPEDLPNEYIFYIKLLKDADKLDILEVFCKYNSNSQRYSELSTVLNSGLPDTPGYSQELVEDILWQRNCRYADIKNVNDRKILQLSWVYDINFDYTLTEILKRNYLDKIISTLPRTEDIEKIHQSLLSYITQRKSYTN